MWTVGFFSHQYAKTTGYENSKSNEGIQEKNGWVKGRDRSAEELDRETGEEQTTLEGQFNYFMGKNLVQAVPSYAAIVTS